MNPRRLLSPLLTGAIVIFPAAAQATLLISESFNYTGGSVLNGQGSTGSGLNGSWAAANGTDSTWNVAPTGLAMSGVASSGNSSVFSQTPNGRNALYATRSLSSPLPVSSTIYGSFLFSVPQKTANLATVQFGVILGGATDDDNAASYFFSGDGYGTQNPLVKTENANGGNGGISVTAAETYIYLFQANATTGNTQAWVLSSAQFAFFSGSLTAAALNAATTNTTANNGVVYRANVTTATAIGAVSAIRLLGYSRPEADPAVGGPGPNGYQAVVDEFRISDNSLFEAATAIPETSTTVVAAAFAASALLRRRRSVA
jgi:hypothetical protein